MKRRYGRQLFFGISLTLAIYLFTPTFLVLAQDSKSGQSSSPAEQPAAGAVDAHVAGMTDEQVRQAYAQKLKQEAAAKTGSTQAAEEKGTWQGVDTGFFGAAQKASAVLKRIGGILSGERRNPGQWSDVVAKLSGGKGTAYLLGTVGGLVLIIALGLALRWLFRRSTLDLQENLTNAVRLGKLQFLGRVLARMLLEALGICIYMLATFIALVVFYEPGDPNYVVVSVFLLVSHYVIVFAFGARIIFSPSASALRLFPLKDRDASFLYKWIIRIVIIAGFFAGISAVFRQLGVSKQLFLMIYSSAGAAVILVLVIMIWQSRQRVGQAIWSEDADAGSGARSMRAALAGNWHYFAMLYVLAAGGIWVTKALNEENVAVVNLILSIFLIPIVIGVDQWVQRLLKIASGESRETIDLSGDKPTKIEEQAQAAGKMDLIHYVPLIRRFFRIFLIAFLFFGSLRLWGIDIQVGRMFTRSALSIVLILLLSFITWQLIKARIDQKLKEEMPDDDEEAEEGGAGGSRMGTLLVLLRKFVLAVMFVMVALIILASLGVNIGPLIAGAGVIGLAIGFGAQTLVKDIIAGVFFLIDDAFRVGDFIESGGTKGMVEHISLRSLRLRNPRGPIHTIPFGSMGTVTNNSRDYIISKLDFRVRYDTNVDKVRKIIKKINKKIMKDEEMGPVMLGKLKSQGVRELDDSAMVMRVKFKTVPGEQFVIKREVFRMMQEAFRENGIEFAHRNVTVYLPPGEADGAPDKKALEAGAAAAAAAQQAEEEQLTQKKLK
ncbi:Potassium efflux system KefA protein / Small-conductance mechanosensitive channel [Olavius sp. associated proteobacterium Delta 1]|nr:Potassium efflux system KefA protein / Small-conductance mechanosensitive channel [Olavius sp. associated proteobacterium Delta 1]